MDAAHGFFTEGYKKQNMNLIEEYNKQLERQKHITGIAMKVYNKYHGGLLESAYECAMKYLLELDGYKVEEQKELPMYWDDVLLDKTYRMDLVVDDNIIIELKAVKFISDDHRKQLRNYMNLTHTRWGMLINFSQDRVYSEWYKRVENGIEQVRLM